MQMGARWLTRTLLSTLGLFALGCGGGKVIPRAHAPTLSDDEARCRAAAERESPLVTEWSAAEKASLQARLREGAVAVEYTGCDMRPILGCRLRGSYAWQQTTLSTDTIDIRSEDELFAKLPIGAVGLEGELARTGHLRVKTTISGQYRLLGSAASDVPDYGDCSQATHLLTGISIGSFKLQSGDQISASAGVGVGELGGGVSTESSEAVLREAGAFESCSLSTPEEPNIGCSSPVQAFLEPLPRYSQERGDGTVQVTFSTGQPDIAWELRSDQKFVCRTPCTRWMAPGQLYELRNEKGPQFTTLDVPDMRSYAGESNLELVAYDKNIGKFVTGIALTGSGGGLMFMGGFLALAGSLGEEKGLAVAGAVTAGIGAVMIAPGIYLMVTSGAKTEIYSNRGQVADARSELESLPTFREAGVRVDF